MLKALVTKELLLCLAKLNLYILKAKQIKAKVSFVSIVVRERRKM